MWRLSNPGFILALLENECLLTGCPYAVQAVTVQRWVKRTIATESISRIPMAMIYQLKRNTRLLLTAGLLALLNLSISVSGLQAQSYCIPTFSGGCNTFEDIGQVSLANMTNNTSGCPSTQFTYFPSKNITLTPGQSYTLSITHSGTSSDYIAGAWIDFNGDGDFNDPNEFLFGDENPAGSGSGHVFTHTFTVPSNISACTGRLRTIMTDGIGSNDVLPNASNACGSPTDGEVQDYPISFNTSSGAGSAKLDAGARTVDVPSASCGLGSSEQISTVITNLGQDSIWSIPVKLIVDGQVVATETTSSNDTLKTCDTLKYTFNATADLSQEGQRKVCVVTDYSGDTLVSNDTACSTVYHIPTITPPYFTDFEDGALPWRSGGTNSSWEYGQPGGFDISNAFSGDSAWVTDLDDDYRANESSYVLAPCFDFTGVNNPILRTYVQWSIDDFGSNQDGVVVQYSTNGGSTWNVLGSTTSGGTNWYNETGIASMPGGQGDGWSGDGNNSSNGWVQAEHDLSPVANQSDVKIRFLMESTSNTPFDEGFAVDNFQIFEKQDFDLGVVEVTAPQGACTPTSQEPITLKINNYGLKAQGNFELGFRVNGGPVQTETYSGSNITPGDTITYTFQNQFVDMSNVGNYDIEVFIADSADSVNNFNDTVQHTAVNFPIISSYPYFENFDNGKGSWQSGGPINSWQHGPPNGGSHIQNAFSSPNAWSTAHPEYAPGEDSYVSSPCFDFSSLSAPVVQSQVYWEIDDGFFDDDAGVVLQYTTDDGQTWKRLRSVGTGQNWFSMSGLTNSMPGGQTQGWSGEFNEGSEAWVQAQNTMFDLANEPEVRFRFKFDATEGVGTAEGFGFDDFLIKQGPEVNITPKQTFLCPSDSVTLEAQGNSQFTDYFWTNQDTDSTTTVSQANLYIVQVTDQDGFTARDTAEVEASDVTAVLGNDRETCEAGSVTLKALQIDSATTYSWSNGVSGPSQKIQAPSLVGGQDTTLTYELIASDTNGCSDTDRVDVRVNPDPTFNLGPDKTLCAGNNVLLDAGQVVPNSTYQWSNGSKAQKLFVTSGGTYWVKVTSPDGCSATDTIDVNVQTPPNVNLGDDIFECNDLSNVTLDANTPATSYQWYDQQGSIPGATAQTYNPSNVGLYSVEATGSNGCTARDTVVVGKSTQDVANLPNDTTACGNITLDGGSDGQNYLWSNGATSQQITVSSSGSYFLEVTDRFNCVAFDSVTVQVQAPVTADFWMQDTVAAGDSVQYIDGSFPTPQNRFWQFEGANIDSSTQRNPVVTYANPGKYAVTLRVKKGKCIDTLRDSIVVRQSTDRSQSISKAVSSMRVYPNPNEGAFNLSAQFHQPVSGTIRLTNMEGKVLYSSRFDQQAGFEKRIAPDRLSAGVYVLEMTTPLGSMHSKILVR